MVSQKINYHLKKPLNHQDSGNQSTVAELCHLEDHKIHKVLIRNTKTTKTIKRIKPHQNHSFRKN